MERCLLGRRTTNMSHVDGVDDWVGYGVYGKTVINVGVVGESNNGYDVYDLSNSLDGKPGGQFKI